MGDDLNAGPGDPHPNASAAAASFNTAAGLLGVVWNHDQLRKRASRLRQLADRSARSDPDRAAPASRLTTLQDFPTAPALDEIQHDTEQARIMSSRWPATPEPFHLRRGSHRQFFGAYFTGVQLVFFADVITFSDGTSRSIDLPGVTERHRLCRFRRLYGCTAPRLRASPLPPEPPPLAARLRGSG